CLCQQNDFIGKGIVGPETHRGTVTVVFKITELCPSEVERTDTDSPIIRYHCLNSSLGGNGMIGAIIFIELQGLVVQLNPGKKTFGQLQTVPCPDSLCAKLAMTVKLCSGRNNAYLERSCKYSTLTLQFPEQE